MTLMTNIDFHVSVKSAITAWTRSKTTIWSPRTCTGRPTGSRTQSPSRMTYTPSGCSTAFQDKIRITPEVGRKLNGEKIICFKAFVSFNNFKEKILKVIGLHDGDLPQVLWNFQTPRPKGYPKIKHFDFMENEG